MGRSPNDMDTRVLLYALPGLPLQLEDLTPQHLLARCAGALRAQGHQAIIIDDGTVDAFGRIDIPDLSSILVAALDERQSTHSRWSRFFSTTRKFNTQTLAACLEFRVERAVAEISTSPPPPSMAVLLIQQRKDVGIASRLAQALKARWPTICVAVTGTMAVRYGRQIMSACPDIDAACIALPESSVPSLAAHAHDQESWCQIPGVLSRRETHLFETPATTSAGIPANTLPAYHPTIYPALLDGGKFRLFTLKQTWGRSHIGHYRGGQPGPVQAKPLRQLRREMIELHELYGAQAFHISGSHTPADLVLDFARECSSLPFPIAYSRNAHVLELRPPMIAALAASGCRAVGFSLLTGSQMNLTDYFGENWNIGTAQACLRACGNAGMYLHVDLLHPVPADDYHSRAETVRMLHRCRPNSLRLLLPSLVPGSAWHQHAAEFEYSTQTKRLDTWVATPTLRMNTLQEAGILPYTLPARQGSTAKDAHALFHAELTGFGPTIESGCQSGMIARISEQPGKEDRFVQNLERAIKILDQKALHRFVNTFNMHATASINTIDCYPTTATRKAVGD